jgi:hypothetical protein
MNVWGSVGAVCLVLVFASGCSATQPVLPDRAAPAVKAEEARIAKVLAADHAVLGVPGRCTVRLLGQQAGASFVMADCKSLDSEYATYGPKRIDGDKITQTADGPGTYVTMRQMFPEDLADFVLENHDSPELHP